MNTLAETLRLYCGTLPALSESEANQIFTNLRGRDDFGPRLSDWLNRSQDAFPELVRAQVTDHVTDSGMDVLFEALNSRERVGFQLKSNNDMKEGLLAETKRQYAESLLWKRSLYIIVLGCDSKYLKYYQHVINYVNMNWQDSLVLEPRQAASLWKACENSLTGEVFQKLLKGRTWERFFLDVEQKDRKNQFLQHWPTLLPHERFVPPKEWNQLIDSVQRRPLTILVGPPAVGKTFAVTNLLYQRYQDGHPVVWFAPNEGDAAKEPVPLAASNSKMKLCIAKALRRMELSPDPGDSDADDVIPKLLKPNSWIFIEDPFGATDADFAESLQSYSLNEGGLFDLRRFVEVITREGSRRRDCRLILTSRAGLFERWCEEMLERNMALPDMEIVTITPNSYNSYVMDPADHPLVQLAGKLLIASGKIDASAYDPHSEFENKEFAVARYLGERAVTPTEIELSIFQIPSPATLESVEQFFDAFGHGVATLAKAHCRAETDAERLFLFLLCGHTTFWYKNRDFSRYYDLFHRALNLSGTSADDELAARRRYWGLYYTIPVTRSKYNRENMQDVSSKEWLDLMLETVEVPGKTDVLPTHPSIKEVITSELQKDSTFISLIALCLDNLHDVAALLAAEANEQGDEDGDEGTIDAAQLQHELFIYLLSFGSVVSLDAAQKLADILPTIAQRHTSLFWSRLVNSMLENWQDLPPGIQESFFNYVQEQGKQDNAQNGMFINANLICGALANFDEFPVEEAWRFYDLALEQRLFALTGLGIASGWEYFLRHLGQAPEHLKSIFEIAVEDSSTADASVFKRLPKPFVMLYDSSTDPKIKMQSSAALLLGRLFPQYWNEMPEKWRGLSLAKAACDDEEVQKEIYWGMSWPLRAKTCPIELISLLRDQLEHPQWKLRALAGTFNLVYKEVLPVENFEAVKILFRTERDARVFRYIWRETRSDKGRCQELVDILNERIKAQDVFLHLEGE